MTQAAVADANSAQDGAAFSTITVKPFVPAIGAELFGVDLSTALSERQFQEIHAALMTHQVVFFHDQQLTKNNLVAFARRFGELHQAAEASFGMIEDYPAIDLLDFGGGKVPYNTKEMWHSDFSGRELPSMGAVLYALEVPSCGGDTIWVSMYAAYEALSDKMKQYLAGMKAEHHALKSFGDDIRSNLWKDEAGRKRMERTLTEPPVEHPVIRTHPVTKRKALYVNEGYTTRLLGVDRKESNAILSDLFEHVRMPEFQCRFRWRKGDLVLWDNRVTQHYAVADYTDRRLMHRIAIKGDRPY
jgi:taurine dioxygenase